MSTTVKVVFSDVTFDGDTIRSASVTEEFSSLGITCPVTELTMELFSEDEAFSIINPTGDYESLMTRQPMAVYEVVDGVEQFIGQFYLDTWTSKSETVKSFQCIDVIGLMDKQDYRGGLYLTPTPVGEIIAAIFGDAGFDYTIDPDLALETVTGWIPICSHREALQQVLFAVGGYVLSARQPVPKIGRLSQIAIATLGQRTGFAHADQSRVWSRRFRPSQVLTYTGGYVVTRGVRSGVGHTGQLRNSQRRWRPSQWEGIEGEVFITDADQSRRKLNLRPQVTGVEVTGHDIVAGDGLRELFNGTLAVGTHEILFSQPMHTLTVSGATISESGANYAILTVATEGTVILSGSVYIDTRKTFTRGMSYNPNLRTNVIRITEATMVNSTNGDTIAQSIFDYYQQRYVQTCRLFSSNARVGRIVNAETLHSNTLFGVVEKSTTNLTGGFISDATIVGVIL